MMNIETIRAACARVQSTKCIGSIVCLNGFPIAKALAMLNSGNTVYGGGVNGGQPQLLIASELQELMQMGCVNLGDIPPTPDKESLRKCN